MGLFWGNGYTHWILNKTQLIITDDQSGLMEAHYVYLGVGVNFNNMK